MVENALAVPRKDVVHPGRHAKNGLSLAFHSAYGCDPTLARGRTRALRGPTVTQFYLVKG